MSQSKGNLSICWRYEMIRIICVGKLKEQYLKDACQEYLKRIQKYTTVEIIEVMDSKMDDETIALQQEKERIEKLLNPKDCLITTEIEGKRMTSVELSQELERQEMTSSNITFLIGGSYGIHPKIKEQAKLKLSFSPLTFPHQLFRVLLLEQIYRSYKIRNHEKYHK